MGRESVVAGGGRHAVVIERGPTSVGAYVPDLPGCVAVGDTVAEVRRLIADAIAFHLEGVRADPRRPSAYGRPWT